MAIFDCNFFSEVLGYQNSVRIILPDMIDLRELDIRDDYKFQVLYLLHGRGDNSTNWSRFVPVERYAKKYKFAVVMPNAEESFYTDSIGGKRYFTYLTKELPKLLQSWFPLSDKKEDNFIAGLSMGGYGALKIGLTYPEKFSGIGSFSGVTDIKGFSESLTKDIEFEFINNLKRVFGDYKNVSAKDDILYLYRENLSNRKSIPMIYQTVGYDDFLYKINTEFRDEIFRLKGNLKYEEWEGDHTWEFWEESLVKFIENMKFKRDVVY